MDRMPCKKCLGKGKTILKNEENKGFDISVTCPSCGGSGYQGIYGNSNIDENYQTNMNIQQNNVNLNINSPIYEQQKEKIIKQIIKYPELFTDGKQFNYIDENIQIFIYLKNQYMFNIKQKETSMLISLKNEYKNKLAEMIINKLKAEKKI